MFHRQNQKTDEAVPQTTNSQTSFLKDPAPKEKSPVEVYAKPEKEKPMFQNQSNTPAPESSEAEGSAAQARPIDIPGNPAGLQRPMQPGGRMPGQFPGSYTAPTGYNPTPGAGQKTDGRRLVVGEGISLSGEIEACDVLIVEGTIEAALKGAKTLDIAETGVFYGTVQIEEAMIAGRFEGDLTVNGRLTIKSTGSITGSVAYKELAVEAGAILDGKVVPLSGSRAEKKPEGRSGQGKKPQTRNDNSGNELPFANTAVQG
jgi:cytoskeletal protein CcmA (bactofilin family)